MFPSGMNVKGEMKGNLGIYNKGILSSMREQLKQLKKRSEIQSPFLEYSDFFLMEEMEATLSTSISINRSTIHPSTKVRNPGNFVQLT